MSDRKKKGYDLNGSLDYILDEHRRKEKKLMENECVTGSDSGNSDRGAHDKEKIKKAVTILTRISLILGILIFIFLWLS